MTSALVRVLLLAARLLRAPRQAAQLRGSGKEKEVLRNVLLPRRFPFSNPSPQPILHGVLLLAARRTDLVLLLAARRGRQGRREREERGESLVLLLAARRGDPVPRRQPPS